MKKNIQNLLSTSLQSLLQQGGIVVASESDFTIERPKEKKHGDFSSNIALILAKANRQPPRQVAEQIIAHLPRASFIKKVEIAGPGFINFYLTAEAAVQVVAEIISQGTNFGANNLGQGQRVLIEFVSSNPTGPLHVGHGRGAAFGASLANLLAISGYQVHREYYVNDAGRQMNILAVSVWLRYLMLLDQPVRFPANAYRGDYVASIAEALLDKHGAQYVQDWAVFCQDLPPDEPDGGDKEDYIDAVIQKAILTLGKEGFQVFHQYALQSVLADIKDDLAEFGVSFDQWFSEQSLLDNGAISKGIQALTDAGHTYEKNGALWFKTTSFGDEKDRVLIRANGQTTYFASDVAYHWDKYARDFDRVIDIFGSDHHGYVPRVRAAVTALGHDEKALTILLVQFAILYRGHERVQMSTRSGSFVTLRELRQEVGNDAARFFYVIRKPDQHMDFDLDLAKSESSDNPVYYIQYAHARICSVLRQLQERGLLYDQKQGLSNIMLLSASHEIELIDLLNRYQEVIETAAQQCDPHLVAYYLRELANGLHSYYNAVQLLCEDQVLRAARICLLGAVRQVLGNGLHLLGVSSPESM